MIRRMLNLNVDIEEDEDLDSSNVESQSNPIWKVLIFDTVGRDIVSSVLRVNDLFKCGITVHMLINSERYAIPDVPAVYFVAPTKENVELIAKDLTNGLYESSYLNFTSPIPRDLLEDLAAQTIFKSSKISQVYDQYLNFVVTEPNTFTLNMPQVYSTLSAPRITEQQIEQTVSRIVDGLFSVVLTFGAIPVIRSPRGNAAEMVAQKLDEKLRNHYINIKSLGSRNPSNTSTSRPVLVILDRNIDLVSMLAHSWTYEALVHDACDLSKNRITIETSEGEGANEKRVKKSYDLDPHDFFWGPNATQPFPQVADNLDAQLNKYRQETKELTAQTGIDDIQAAAATLQNGGPSVNASHLKAAITALPELTARKATIDMHMNIATALLKAIGDRGLAQLFEAETNAQRMTKGSLLELINNPAFSNVNDKLRLYLVYLLSTNSNIDNSDVENVLTSQGADLAPVKYIKQVKDFNKLSGFGADSTASFSPLSQAQSSDLFKGLGGIRNKLVDRLKDGKLSEGFGNIISGVRNLLPANKDLPVTRIVESLLDPSLSAGGGSGSAGSSSATSAADDYLYFDPQVTRGSSTRPPRKSAHEEALVFMVGGGNYLEYANIQDWVERTGNSKHVAYGSTDLTSPEQFLAECGKLASQ